MHLSSLNGASREKSVTTASFISITLCIPLKCSLLKSRPSNNDISTCKKNSLAIPTGLAYWQQGVSYRPSWFPCLDMCEYLREAYFLHLMARTINLDYNHLLFILGTTRLYSFPLFHLTILWLKICCFSCSDFIVENVSNWWLRAGWGDNKQAPFSFPTSLNTNQLSTCIFTFHTNAGLPAC